MLLKKVEMKIRYFEGFHVRLVEIKGSCDVRGDARMTSFAPRWVSPTFSRRD